MRRRTPLTGVLAAVLLFAACNDEEPRIPGSLTVSAGDQQLAVVGSALAIAPAVVLKDTKGRPMNRVTVTFAVTSGGGSLAGVLPVKTDANGVATAGVWTLGTGSGVQQVTATAAGVAPVVFTATANPGAPATLEASAGNGQVATVATPLAIAPAVVVRDSYGNVVPNEAVTFAVTAGGGSVTGAIAVTDATGTARTGGWTLGTTMGTNSLRAAATNGVAVTFTAVGNPGPAARMAVHAGDGQQVETAAQAPVRPAVVVRDQYDNPVAGVSVTFTVTAGGGAVTGSQQITGTDGIATVDSWTMGSTVGANTLLAQAEGLNAVAFTATIKPVLTITIHEGDGQSAPVGWTVPVAPSVRVRDQQNNPVAGITVTFQVEAGGGTVTDATATTNASGIARIGWWRLGTATGANSLTANVSDVKTLTFAATATTAPPATGYHISIAYVAVPTTRQHQAVLNAVARWQQVITGDLGDIRNINLAASSCTPAFVNDNIDDILVLVDFSTIDGPKGILGMAGPCLVRQSDTLTAVGRLAIDAADLAMMEADGTIDDVITHEIGHVLGIGSLWGFKKTLSFAQTDSSTFTGPAAGAAFLANGGNTFAGNPVPVENCKTAAGTPITGCGGGTRDGHWREAVMGRELMTGYISPAGTANPLSAVTVQSLADIGYTVNAAAGDHYTVGLKPIPGIDTNPLHLQEAKPPWQVRSIND